MKKRQFIFHGWLIVAAGIVAHALGYGSRYSFAVIFPSLLAEFQWPRDITAAMLSFGAGNRALAFLSHFWGSDRNWALSDGLSVLHHRSEELV